MSTALVPATGKRPAESDSPARAKRRVDVLWPWRPNALLDLPLDVVEHLLRQVDVVTLAVLVVIPYVRIRWARAVLLHLPRYHDPIRAPWLFGRFAICLLLRAMFDNPHHMQEIQLFSCIHDASGQLSTARRNGLMIVRLRAIHNAVVALLVGCSIPNPVWAEMSAFFAESNVELGLSYAAFHTLLHLLSHPPKRLKLKKEYEIGLILHDHVDEMRQWLHAMLFTTGPREQPLRSWHEMWLQQPAVVRYLEELLYTRNVSIDPDTKAQAARLTYEIKESYTASVGKIHILPARIKIWVGKRPASFHFRREVGLFHPEFLRPPVLPDTCMELDAFDLFPVLADERRFPAYQKIRRFVEMFPDISTWQYEIDFDFYSCPDDEPYKRMLLNTILSCPITTRIKFVHGAPPTDYSTAQLRSLQFLSLAEVDIFARVPDHGDLSTFEAWASLT